MEEKLNESLLGKSTTYISQYTPSLLYPIPRKEKRTELNIDSPLPFYGVDIWTAYELSWLNPKGKPIVAVGVFTVPCRSINIIESKSFKLYLNSLNQTKFHSIEEVRNILIKDLSKAAESSVSVELYSPVEWEEIKVKDFQGECIDSLDVDIDLYTPYPDFIQIENEKVVDETLYSDLLKSNCPVTSQPDWASIVIRYRGQKIERAGLLKYIVSYRNHNDFHEQCIERIFTDIRRQCSPERLTVYARYTRRGGLDINPFRTDFEDPPQNIRTFRQ